MKKLVFEPTVRTWLMELRDESRIAHALMKVGERTTENGNFVNFDKATGLWSYSPRRVDKDGNPLELGFKEKGRVEGKTGRVIRRFLTEPDKYTDAEWEAFHNSIVALSQGNLYTFGFVRGEDIRHFYDQKNYSKSKRQAIYSCMSGADAQKYLDIYAKNPNAVELFCCFDARNNLLLGRSLVWTCTDGNKYHDTVYGGDVIRQAMVNELKAQGITALGYGGDRTWNTLEVQLENVVFSHYPSVDRFRYLDTVTKTANMHGRNFVICMTGTDGRSWSTQSVICSGCGKLWAPQNARAHEGKVFCKTCAGDLPWNKLDKLVYGNGAPRGYYD